MINGKHINIDELKWYKLERGRHRSQLVINIDKIVECINNDCWSADLKAALAQAQYAYDSASFTEYKIELLEDKD